MEAQTITCPNCGASTSNYQNCEYCGSFLVRQVSRGLDVSNYIERIPTYHNEVILKILKKSEDIIKQLKNLGVSGNSPALFIKFGNAWIGNETTGILVSFDEAKDSYCISIATVELEGLGVSKEDFMNSEIGSFFTYSEEDCQDTDEWDMSVFEIEFGHDIKGAADFICQLLDKVFRKKVNQVNYQLTLNGYQEHSVSYNSKGVVTDEQGAGINEFANISMLETELSSKKQSKNVGKIVLGILLFILLMVSFYIYMRYFHSYI